MEERTEEEKAEIKSSFSAKKRNQFIIILLIMPALFIVLQSKRMKVDPEWGGIPWSVWQGIAIALILGSVAFSFVNWRCPACKGYLGRGMFPRFCAKCGAELS